MTGFFVKTYRPPMPAVGRKVVKHSSRWRVVVEELQVPPTAPIGGEDLTTPSCNAAKQPAAVSIRG